LYIRSQLVDVLKHFLVHLIKRVLLTLPTISVCRSWFLLAIYVFLFNNSSLNHEFIHPADVIPFESVPVKAKRTVDPSITPTRRPSFFESPHLPTTVDWYNSYFLIGFINLRWFPLFTSYISHVVSIDFQVIDWCDRFLDCRRKLRIAACFRLLFCRVWIVWSFLWRFLIRFGKPNISIWFQVRFPIGFKPFSVILLFFFHKCPRYLIFLNDDVWFLNLWIESIHLKIGFGSPNP